MNMTKSVIQKLLVMNDKQTGARLKERRKELGVSQTELAKILNVCQAEISNVENGAKKAISVWSYCQALKVNPQYLITGR